MDREKVSSSVWFSLSLAIIIGSCFYNYGTWSHPGPAFLPLWCGIIMAILSSIIFLRALWEDKIGRWTKGKDSFLTSRWPKLVIVIFILSVFAVLLETLGFIIMTFVSMFGLLKVVGKIKWRIALIEAALATIISYTLFEIWLNVPLPAGFLPSLFKTF
jgi:putative tricarboxylic transport membrane protein